MITVLIIIFLFSLLLVSFLLARKDDKVIELEQRVMLLEQRVNKKIVSRLLYRLEDVNDEWWNTLSQGDL